METYQLLCLFGFPSIFVTILVWVVAKIKKQHSDSQALKLGVQSLLMDKLDYLHDKYVEQGYCPTAKKRLYDNMYNQYANLGANGVMAEAHEEVMKLPSKPRN